MCNAEIVPLHKTWWDVHDTFYGLRIGSVQGVDKSAAEREAYRQFYSYGERLEVRKGRE